MAIRKNSEDSTALAKQRTMILLMLTVTVVLLALILRYSQAWLVVLAVIIVLTTLILVVGEASHQIPHVLKIILSEIGQILTILEIFTLIFSGIKQIFATLSNTTKRGNGT